VTEAEGQKRAVELAADAELYAAEQTAKARRIEADAEAYATGVVAKAIADNGLEAAQYQVALKQVEALNTMGQGQGAAMTASLPTTLLVFAVTSLVSWVVLRQVLGIRKGQVKVWDKDINDG